ncbi:ketoacyl-ACP synthase III family protein [Actinomadura barringtoniae]|uniref:Ketoacyl-ACP synthase III family protein n=1 Tax=Actinomadura barringtoniae TaxID=1427535 RepID=A0A939P5W6_9ACTN|nr:ketoacyl-ACP synthase III family protein [Actinomadura barringtoniae]MBO2445590.1 ketoacyl-ACP synthase III family protein [Actinomadura barringtoniae]
MRFHDMFIASAGMHLPPKRTLDEAIARGEADESDREELSVTAVRVAGSTPAADLAVRATREVVERAGAQAAGDVDAFFYVTGWHQGPEGWSPQFYVLRHGLGRDIPAFEVRQGCNGFVAALELAASYLLASPDRTAALIAAAENFETPLVDRWHSSPASAFGDGATALMLSRREGFARLLAVTLTSITELEESDRYGEEMHPPGITLGVMADHRIRARRYIDSFTTGMPPLFMLLPAAMTKTIEQCAADAGIKVTDIKRVCHVNVNDGFLKRFVLEPLGLDPTIGTMDFGRQNGHMTASDTVASFTHLVETRQVGPGDHVLLFTSAPGQSIACALIRIDEDPGWHVPAEGR